MKLKVMKEETLLPIFHNLLVLILINLQFQFVQSMVKDIILGIVKFLFVLNQHQNQLLIVLYMNQEEKILFMLMLEENLQEEILMN